MLQMFRSGTLGLYYAMQILGYNTYHIYECVAVNGVTHIKMFKEAITAQYNRLSGIKRYNQDDCNKWLEDYDVSRSLNHLIQIRRLISSSVSSKFPATLEWISSKHMPTIPM